ncbi:MAG: hypothetical protein U1E53_33420 [Dongiaceae bacterium]
MARQPAGLSATQRAVVLAMLLTLALPLLLAYASKYLPGLRPPPLDSEAFVPKPPLRATTLLSGDFQRAAGAWFVQALPPRRTAVQLSNQLYYDLFGRSYMYDEQILVGRGDSLFEVSYVDRWCRADATDLSALQRTAARIGALRRRWARDGRVLLFVATPSKAAVMPELLPAACPPPADPGRPRRALLAMLAAEGVPTFDGDATVRAMKGRDPVSPFPTGGIHWSSLAGRRVAGMIMADLGRLAGADLGGVSVADLRWDAAPAEQDADLRMLANLYAPLPEAVGAGRLVCRPAAAGRGARLIAVGGSFLRTILETIGGCGLFAEVDYFFNYTRLERRWPGGGSLAVDRATLDWRRRLDAARVLILELNDAVIVGGAYALDPFLDDVEAAPR